MNAYAKQNEFYNKFLQAQVVADPLTPEEKKRLLMIQYIKHQQERQHIMRVKSKKMNFVYTLEDVKWENYVLYFI